jgi:NAD(P)-dependent dehydrogenase (short-subunit alcohol dehydrogenase family)
MTGIEQFRYGKRAFVVGGTTGMGINAICPGPTDTLLARANADLWLSFGQDYREATGIQVHQPEQMGNAMVFLNSPAASAVNGDHADRR